MRYPLLVHYDHQCSRLVLICLTVVHGPGYEERRKERLKEKYGIVVHE